MIKGKGMWMWGLIYCHNGDPAAIAAEAQRLGLTHVLIKLSDGTINYNVSADIPAIIAALRAVNVLVIAWFYAYGAYPEGEADKIAARAAEFGIDIIVINAEVEFKGRPAQAARLANRLVLKAPNAKFGLSTYRFPSYHQTFPYAEFLEICDFAMPQVYWLLAHNPAEQLIRTVTEWRQLTDLPIIPTGSAYKYGTWKPTTGELVQFMDKAQELELPAANFWDWQHAQQLPDLWAAIADYDWPVDPGQEPEPMPVDLTPLLLELQKVNSNLIDVQSAINAGTDRIVQAINNLPSSPAPGGSDPTVPAVKYKVVSNSTNKREKVRPSASMAVAEIDFVYDGQIVGGPGKETNEFTYITWREGTPVLSGFVETAVLVRV